MMKILLLKAMPKCLISPCIAALVISNAVMFVAGVMIMWCSFDVAGRDWVKLKKYQKSLKNQACMHRTSFSTTFVSFGLKFDNPDGRNIKES